MDIQKNYVTPVKYKQPTGPFYGRSLDNNNLENVDYIPESHIRIWYNNQPESYAMHWHNAIEIAICIENSYTYVINGKQIVLNVGDILFIPSNLPHEIICNNDGIRFILLFNIEAFKEFTDYKSMVPIFIESYLCNALVCPNIYQAVYSSFMNIIDIYFENPILWETKILSILLNVFSTIGTNYFTATGHGALSGTEQKSREYFDKISYLLNYISDNYAEEITLDQAASYIGFSKYHFTRLFKQYTNSTFYEYLCHKRIQAAQSLLSEDVPITDIVFQTGFNNMTTFCRCFKKITNCTPSEYRNSFREERVKQ